MAGIALAAQLGYRGVEFDVMLSGDGEPLLIHDETLERTTSGSGLVAATPLAALRRLDAGARFHRAYGGEKLPTLAEAAELCRRLQLIANVEIKPAPGREKETGEAVGRLLAGGDAAMMLLSSFAPAALAAAAEAAPQLPRALLFEAVPADWRAQLAALGGRGLHCAATGMDAALAAELAAAGMPWAAYTVNRRDEAERLFGLGAAALFTDRLDLFRP